jgi:hypothetical protein
LKQRDQAVLGFLGPSEEAIPGELKAEVQALASMEV